MHRPFLTKFCTTFSTQDRFINCHLCNLLWRLRRAPLAVDACGAGGPPDEYEAAVALVHDLAVVANLPDVGAVLVEAHAAHQKHLAVFNEPGKGAEH